MRINISYLLLTGLVLFGCADDNVPGLEAHDTKYVALGANSEPLSTGAPVCVQDSITGLIWASKTDVAGLHDWRNTYSWFKPDESVNELDYRGVADGGECVASACDISAYVLAVNAAGYCGHSDWRMPSRDELMSISDLRKAKTPPTANMAFFPYMQPSEYWSGFDYSAQYQSAWAWNFFYGHDRVDWKKSAKYVRLVRGTANGLESVKD